MPRKWNDSKWNAVAADTGTVASGTELHWHIIESSDRWFQAHQRLVASTPTSLSANVMRWDGQSLVGLLARLKQPVAKDTSIYLVWEYPLGDITPTRIFELIAAVSQQNPRPMQMAHLRPGVANATRLAFQEAGISIVLHDLWTLRHVLRRIEHSH